MRTTKSFRAAGFLLPLTLLIGVSLAQETKPKPETARHRFKNIKVLKDIPADDLMPMMQKVNMALGVKCDFCHVSGAPERDDNPHKNAARKMIQMTMDINKKYKAVEMKVTCYTCHKGHAEPENMPAGMMPGKM